jgi:hypothetical protein
MGLAAMERESFAAAGSRFAECCCRGLLKPQIPCLEISDVTRSREGALSVLDWDATLKSAPDLKSLTRDGNPRAFPMSACDGNWTLFPVSAKAEEITKLSAEAGVSTKAALDIQSKITWWQEALVIEQKARLAEAEKSKGSCGSRRPKSPR